MANWSLKKVSEYIDAARRSNKSDQEIYYELLPIYYDKRTVVRLLSFNPDIAIKEKYKKLNHILLGSLILHCIYVIIFVFKIEIETDIFIKLFMLSFVLVFMYGIMYGIYLYIYYVYKLCFLMYFAAIFAVFSINTLTFFEIVDAMLGVVMAGLSFYLSKKIKPKYDVDKLSRDEKGDFILN